MSPASCCARPCRSHTAADARQPRFHLALYLPSCYTPKCCRVLEKADCCMKHTTIRGATPGRWFSAGGQTEKRTVSPSHRATVSHAGSRCQPDTCCLHHTTTRGRLEAPYRSPLKIKAKIHYQQKAGERRCLSPRTECLSPDGALSKCGNVEVCKCGNQQYPVSMSSLIGYWC